MNANTYINKYLNCQVNNDKFININDVYDLFELPFEFEDFQQMLNKDDLTNLLLKYNKFFRYFYLYLKYKYLTDHNNYNMDLNDFVNYEKYEVDNMKLIASKYARRQLIEQINELINGNLPEDVAKVYYISNIRNIINNIC